MKKYKASFLKETDSLINLCESITDCHHSTPKYISNGKFVIRNFNIKDGRMLLANMSFTDEENYKLRISRAKPEPGDLIMTREAPMGEVCIIPPSIECCLGQRLVLIKPNLNKIDNRYLLYTLLSEFTQIQIGKSKGTGSIVSNLRIPLLEELKIPCFKIQEQKKIGSTLGAIDEKIELNYRINAELESMAKTLYDYWFVQFDFPDNNGRPYKSSGGKMVWNEKLKRDIPEGWEVKSLSEITSVCNEQLNPMDTPDKDFRHYSIPAFDSVGTYKIEKGSEILSNKFIIKESDLLVSKLNPWFSRVIYATDDSDLISSTEFVVWRCDKKEKKNYMYMIARDASFIAYCSRSATGTSNSHKRVNPTVMMKYMVAYNEKAAVSFGKILGSTLEIYAKNQIENNYLSELRDFLLPMFMNGQVKVI